MTSIDYCLDKARAIPYVKGQTRHYAVVVNKRGRVVGEGRNEYLKTHPLAAKAGKAVGLPAKECVHAELSALLGDRYRKGVKLVVCRVDSRGRSAYSEPCHVCKYTIKEYFPNIKSVEYSI